MKNKDGRYFLTPSAIASLREQRKWSVEEFGRTTTKRYFQDLADCLELLAQNPARSARRPELKGLSGLMIYPLGSHYIIYAPVKQCICVFGIVLQTRDVLPILNENAALFKRELAQFEKTFKPQEPKLRTRKKS